MFAGLAAALAAGAAAACVGLDAPVVTTREMSKIDAVAEALAAMLRDPEAVCQAQAAGFERLRSRSWSEAAEEWIDVLGEAIERHRAWSVRER